MGDDADIARDEHEAEKELEQRVLKKRSERKSAAAATTEDISAELAATIEASKRADYEKKHGYEFPTTARAAKEKPLRTDLARVVETVFVVDIHDKWTRLRKALQVGENRSDHGALQKALDRAEWNAQEAHRLYVTAKLEMERWELENEVIFGGMWAEANHALNYEKEEGTRRKQITDADVRAKVASLHPVEWRTQEQKRRAVKLTVDSLSNLAECWMSRCRSLQAMLAKLRG